MKITERQLKFIIENYLSEQEETDSETETESDVADIIAFKVKNKDGNNVNIELKKNEKGLHKIFVEDSEANDINPEMELQVIATHGYIHKDTDDETKAVLRKIIDRDPNFAGKSDNAVIAMIDDKMSPSLGKQGLGLDNLEDILAKG